MIKRALIYIDAEALEDSLDLLDAVEQMYGREAYESYGLCVKELPKDASGALDYWIHIEDEGITHYDILNLTNCIEELQRKYSFDAVLIPATTFGRMLAPRAAMRLHVGLVADVTAIRHRNSQVEMVRPAFSGRMLAGILNQGAAPLMMSIRQNTFTLTNTAQKETRCIGFTPDRMDDPGIRLIERRPKPVTEDIRDSAVLISGGGGVQRNFNKLESLARELNGMVSASRKVVDSGAAPRHIQVGQSGKTVSPKIYIALGISGSIQHVVGLKNAEYIISVNKDRHAPICSLSDIVVEGDAREFIDRLLEKLKNGRNHQTPLDKQ
jgi:electron transfer flavoprotein alpha subunit